MMPANDFESRLYSLEAHAKRADETSDEVDRLKDIISAQSLTMTQSIFELKEIIASQSATMMSAVRELKEMVSGSGAHNIGHTRRIEALEKFVAVVADQGHEPRIQALEKASIGAHAVARFITWAPVAALIGGIVTMAGWVSSQFLQLHK